MLAHDWLIGRRGGEAVLETFADVVESEHEPAGLYTLFDSGAPISPAIDRRRRTVSPLNAIPGANGSLRRWLLPLYPWGVGRLSRRLAHDHGASPIDLVVSTSSGLIKGIAPPAGVPHLCYCHAPARYLWSVQDEYTRGGGVAAAARRIGFGVFTPFLRAWDRGTADRVSKFVANSTHIAREIERCFGREAEVLHPPVDTAWFTPADDPAGGKRGFWLVVAALEPYKRTDLAIRAAARAGKRLIVAGTGSDAEALRSLARSEAPELIEFEGRVTRERLRELYRTADLLLFPQIEDFGIIAVEAQACGCPVVARRAGGAIDSVIEGRTGAFFEDPSPEEIAAAAGRVPSDAAAACRANAEGFGATRFRERASALIDGMLTTRAG